MNLIMRNIIVILSLIVLSGCLATTKDINITTLGQLDKRDLRFMVYVEAPAKIKATETRLLLTLSQQDDVLRQEALSLKLLGIEHIEKFNGMFAFDIDYNGQLLSLDSAGQAMFDQLKQQYPDALFRFDIEPRFVDLPNKDTMYFSVAVRLTRAGDFEDMTGNQIIDVPRD